MLCAAAVYCQNADPIILIHGFLGWGRDEMAGYYYWGGRMDLESELRDAGFEIYTVSVGPISPNWDRAIEAFYQIKGGQVDYGNEKAQKHGIIQRPTNKKYDGLFPEWDAQHPIHIISHSQGGQTARMLELLLKRSNTNEDSPLLSNQYNRWIKSITTISTPHNGSTLVPIMTDMFPFAQNLAPWFGGIENNTLDKLYNFDLEHWGLEKYPGESTNDYFSRLSESAVSESKNLCTWDLSLLGADEFNKQYRSDKDLYYFSFSTYSTKPEKNGDLHKPDADMSFHLWPTSLLMGQYNNAPDSRWYENDGVCNTVSMSHPQGLKAMDYDGKPVRGVWQHVEKLHMDHQAVIGHNVSRKEHENILALYKNHCSLLYSLK